MPVLEPVGSRVGQCRGKTLVARPSTAAAVRWHYGVAGKPWRLFVVSLDGQGRLMSLEAWYVRSAVVSRNAGQLVYVDWNPDGSFRYGHRVLDTTGPMSRAKSNRASLSTAEIDSARILARDVLAKCAQ